MTSLELLQKIDAWLSFNNHPSKKQISELRNGIKKHISEQLNIPAVSNRREQLIAFAQWLAHEEEYGKDGSVGTVDAYLESN